MKNMQEFWDLTKKFNDLSGASQELSEKAFLEQYSYIREEFNEMSTTLGYTEDSIPSLESYMLESLLDDTLDVIITAFGMLHKLENLGIDINGAALATAHNNLSKYPVRPYIAHETVDRLFMKDGTVAEAKFNEQENCFIIRDVNTGKVKKPFNFIPNDLRQFIPEEAEVKYAEGH